MSRFALLSLIPLTLVAAGAVGRAQAKGSVWDGIYSAAQAGRGKALYTQHCAGCHGNDLEGKDMAAPLAGIEFRGNWNSLSVGDLVDRIRATMPADAPQSLTRTQYLDIVGYIFQKNEFPAGTADLPSDDVALKALNILGTKP